MVSNLDNPLDFSIGDCAGEEIRRICGRQVTATISGIALRAARVRVLQVSDLITFHSAQADCLP